MLASVPFSSWEAATWQMIVHHRCAPQWSHHPARAVMACTCHFQPCVNMVWSASFPAETSRSNLYDQNRYDTKKVGRTQKGNDDKHTQGYTLADMNL